LINAIKRDEFRDFSSASTGNSNATLSRIANIDDSTIEDKVGESLSKWGTFESVVAEIEKTTESPSLPTKEKKKETIKQKISKLINEKRNVSSAETSSSQSGELADESSFRKKFTLKRSSSTGRIAQKSQPLMSRFMTGRIVSRKQKEENVSHKTLSDTQQGIVYDEMDISDVAPDFSTIAEAQFAELNQKHFDRKYQIVETELGTGGHSTVRLAIRKKDQAFVVCKLMQAQSVWHWKYDKESQRKLPLEIVLMKKFSKMKIPGIILYHEHFEMAGQYIIVMDYMGDEWVDLYDYIEMFGPVNEKHSREIFRKVVDTLQIMHGMGLCHNDIKDENVLINPKTREVKLIDFGSTTPIYPGKTCKLFYGTKKFSAPEAIADEPYFPDAQEVWGLGTLLYVLLFKMDPFKGDEEILDVDIGQRIKRLRNVGKSNGGVIISAQAEELICSMLEKDWRRRTTIMSITDFAFFHSK
jgi:tRNA A-37 threonylcarbamoyl transferase component Bud32